MNMSFSFIYMNQRDSMFVYLIFMQFQWSRCLTLFSCLVRFASILSRIIAKTTERIRLCNVRYICLRQTEDAGGAIAKSHKKSILHNSSVTKLRFGPSSEPKSINMNDSQGNLFFGIRCIRGSDSFGPWGKCLINYVEQIRRKTDALFCHFSVELAQLAHMLDSLWFII